MDCKQRIRDIIEIRLHNLGLRQKDLADSIGVPVSTLNSWLRLGRDIPAQYIIGIADCLQCSPMYLLTGDATEQIDPATLVPHEEEKDADAIRGISDDALKVACLWDGLDEAGKAIILGDIYRRGSHDDGFRCPRWRTVSRGKVTFLVLWPGPRR